MPAHRADAREGPDFGDAPHDVIMGRRRSFLVSIERIGRRDIMQPPRVTPSEVAAVGTPEGSHRPPRRRRIGRLAAVAVSVAALISAAWFATRFDPLGRASAAYGRRQYQAALKAARDHLGRFPGDRSASLMAARCLNRLRRPGEAEAHYRRAEPLGLVDMQDRAYGLVQSGDPEGAAAVYEQLLARSTG